VVTDGNRVRWFWKVSAMADWLVYGLSAMFLIGMLGCLVVIPITAFRLFAILFQHDPEEDQNPVA